MAGKRILIIDDEDDIRTVAHISMEKVGGWQVITARSGREGIEKALAEQPDAILLDVMMPDMDGPSTFRQLQEHDGTRNIPVILLTAKVQAADKQRFAELGVKGVLSKPFDPISLPRQVQETLDSQ